MRNLQHCGPSADPDLRRVRQRHAWLSAAILLLLAACTRCRPDPRANGRAAQPVPFPDAVANAANTVFSTAAAHADTRQVVVIDPLVNGVTGEQSTATQQIQDRIIAWRSDKYPQFDIQPFTAAAVSKAPYVMVGTFTPVNAQGQTAGTREGYRFCLVMVDLRAGKTIAKGVARARWTGVNTTPVGFFRDSPAWTNDASVKSYIDTCQATKVGDAISQTYLNGILTASIVSEAINAYDASRYRDALDLYMTAEKTPAGNQLRVYNGLYLTNWKLGHRDQAADAFGQVVDYGLEQQFARGEDPVPARLDLVRHRTADHRAIRHVAARRSPSHSASQERVPPGHRQQQPVGLRRAQRSVVAAARRLREGAAGDGCAGLQGHVIATGVGAKNNLIGTGADDLSDALDRRVEFKVIPTC